MPFEIEMKAWVDDPEEVERLLQELASYHSSFHKLDRYYHYPKGAPAEGKTIRLRKDGDTTYVTSKDKLLVDGMEENREIEFIISDEEAFHTLLERLGCRAFIEKEKTGKRFQKGDLILELCEVTSLGWFIEVEKIIPERREDLVSQARDEIETVFSQLAITRDKIETRYYIDMLQGKS